MCDFKNGFILCTCVDEEPLETAEVKKEVPVKKMRTKKKKLLSKLNLQPKPQQPIDVKKYKWELRTLKRKEYAVGRFVFPSDDIGKGLESDWVELNLNDRNCFDFEYTPNEGDELIFFNEINRGKYLAFIFKNNTWVQDFYNEVAELTRLEKSGKVKPSKKI